MHCCPAHPMNRLRLPWQERMLKMPVWRRPVMAHLAVILRLKRVRGGDRSCGHVLLVMVVLLESSDGDKRQEVVGVGAGTVQEVGRHRGAGEQMVGGGVSRSSQGACAGTGGPGGAAGGEALHALEVKAVLLQVAGDVLPGQPVDAHELHYGLGDGILDPQVGHGVDEALVELRRPHQAGPLEGAGGLVAAGAGAQIGGISEIGGVGLRG